MRRTDPGAFGAGGRVGGNYATRADSDMRRGACSSGIGLAAKSFWHGFAIMRAQVADRLMRALSVAMPVLAYICR